MARQTQVNQICQPKWQFSRQTVPDSAAYVLLLDRLVRAGNNEATGHRALY